MNTMQTTEASWHCFPTSPEGVVTRLRRVLRGMRGVRQARAVAPRLQSLSDWQLKDIGLDRSQIWYLSYGASASAGRNRHAAD